MKVKRFVAADMRRALELVKQEMGPDAVILSTNRTKAGVEVLTSYHTPDKWEPVISENIATKNTATQDAAEPAQSMLSTAQNDPDEMPMQSDSAWGSETPVGRLLQKHFEQMSDTNTAPATNHMASTAAPQVKQSEYEHPHANSIAAQQQYKSSTFSNNRAPKPQYSQPEPAYQPQSHAQLQNHSQLQSHSQLQNHSEIHDPGISAYPQDHQNYAAPEPQHTQVSPTQVSPAPPPVYQAQTYANTPTPTPTYFNSAPNAGGTHVSDIQANGTQTTANSTPEPTEFRQAPEVAQPQTIVRQPEPELPESEQQASDTNTWPNVVNLSSYSVVFNPDYSTLSEMPLSSEYEMVCESPEVVPEENEESGEFSETMDDFEFPVEDRELMPEDLYGDIVEQADVKELEALKSEIADMRELLQTQLEKLATNNVQGNGNVVSSVRATLNRRLLHLGLPQTDCDKLLSEVDPHASLADCWTEALARFAHRLSIADDNLIDRGGFYAFVGAAGSGKTATLSKLAARYVLKHGPKGVAIISMDSQVIAGQEQLQRLGKILGIKVHLLRENKKLPYLLQDLCDYSLVLIDTAGFSHSDSRLQQQLSILRNAQQVQSILVLATNTQTRMMTANVEAYQPAGISACVLTKMDDTASLGEALSVVMHEELPVAYTTNGQELTRDISVARAHQLVARAVALLKDENQKQKRLLQSQRKQVAFS